MADDLLGRPAASRIGTDGIRCFGREIRETRSVGERLLDGRAVRVDGEVAEIVGQGCVEVDAALLRESHDRSRREDLRDRPDVVRILG